ncbi:hypothetical protein QQ020_24395 [Fulvivirgaceae bacterium BMA12]|uniref:Uncharacterized protein n=1 Tax=Agaribacillus aureus TaxID=3051825 RepID=A0ABT8LFV5_9BACT|nr:hypothetical protein [Fulvivirgaceae bacterium BMA12]
MKKILIFLYTTLFYTITANGQNFFFINEESYSCSETFTLQSNSDDPDVNDLNVILAKDGTTAIFIVSTKIVSTVRISGKLIIYLDDGTVISCIDRGIKDNVDDIASTAYQLTNEELGKMKKSNINTVRYEIKCAECLINLYEGNYTASNKGSSKTDFPVLISDFFEN